jgi:hypothetical protein
MASLVDLVGIEIDFFDAKLTATGKDPKLGDLSGNSKT